MTNTRSKQKFASIGVDIGKDVMHIVGFDRSGAIALRKKIRRLSLEDEFSKLPPSVVGLEASQSAHFISRMLRRLGHDPKIIPAKYVKPFSKGQKNDYNDAEAIAEAVLRPNLRAVPEKTQDQLDLQALHRVRDRLVSRRTATINQIRCFLLEHGIAVRPRTHALRVSLEPILMERADEISPRMRDLLLDLQADWLRLDDRIEAVSAEIKTISEDDEDCRRLMSVPGIGPIISSAVVAAIGTGDAFTRGRDFGAWLGLVPRQNSTGGRTVLGRITKRGSTYLRMLFVQAARVIMMRKKLWPGLSFGTWLLQADARMNRFKLAIALANKLARIAWSVLHHQRRFDTHLPAPVAAI
jgi:transposase